MPKNKPAIFWTETAEKDLEIVIDHILYESKEIAYDIFNLIKSSVLNLENFPTHGRIVPELQYYHINTYREIIVKSWRILYRIEGSALYILAVIEARRNIEDILLERFLKE